MARRCTVRITANFQRNLDSIQAFLAEHDAQRAFAELLGQLFDTIIPNLESFPEIGIDFLARVPRSRQGLLRLDRLKGRLDRSAVVRELIAGDYLILYALRDPDVYLLAIKHHLQLSFDLQGHWGRDDSGG
jgi:plasmid stabilization system protein ParE